MHFLGLSAIMLASFGIGFQSLRLKRKRLQCLREMGDTLALWACELSGKQTPLPDLIKEGSLNASGEARRFLLCLSDSLSELGMRCFSELWINAASELSLLTEEERRELISLGKQLGRTELSRQLTQIDSCRRFFLLRLEKEESALQNNSRFLLGIPAAAGALLSILLL